MAKEEAKAASLKDPEAEAKPPEASTGDSQMGRNTVSVSTSPTPSWFTPKRLLVLFCIINLLNYVDRGAIASNGVNGTRRTCTDGTCTSGSGIQGDFNLNNFEDGVISSAFMVGLLVASPIFASWAKSINPFRLIGVGLSVWTVAVIGCGLSFNFWSITVCRMLVGVGEASFVSLAAPFVDDNAPVAQNSHRCSFDRQLSSFCYNKKCLEDTITEPHFFHLRAVSTKWNMPWRPLEMLVV